MGKLRALEKRFMVMFINTKYPAIVNVWRDIFLYRGILTLFKNAAGGIYYGGRSEFKNNPCIF